MSDRFLYLTQIAARFGKSVATLREVAEAQSGVFNKPRLTHDCLASYPRFTKGPGGKWGIFESQLAAYWSALRRKNDNIVEMARFRAGRNR